MIGCTDNIFFLHTAHTTYAFHVLPTGQLEHLYYGRRLSVDLSPAGEGILPLTEKHTFPPGNTNAYDNENQSYTLEDMRFEMSSYGKGDIRDPFVEIVYGDGSYTSDFQFVSAAVGTGKEPYGTLPGSYDEEGKVDHLTVILKEKSKDVTLELHYYVYEDCDAITRSAKLINGSKGQIALCRLMSCQIDFDMADFDMAGVVVSTFGGTWAREMKRTDTTVSSGRLVNSSYTGTSSNRANPFVMLSNGHTTEDAGSCYGLNLIYSGNHYESVEVSGYGKIRFLSGINPQSFRFVIEPGQSFEAPEAVMVYSNEGYNGMSVRMHHFVREHIVRGNWKKKPRPVLLNSWEASYFDINEKKLLALAKAGKDVGIELFVMDDGWFGKRDDDRSSLGDWKPNLKKLPGGVAGLCRKVNEMGLAFGLWVEPEMVNTDSDLYRAHPDWAIDIPGREHSEGRNQRILDLTREDVQQFVIDSMTEVFSSANIAYVKWDMNRIFSDYFSKSLPPERQGEVAHRYVVGLYRCMRELTEKFPDILFEGCSAGGNRFDLGILCFFPQIWASDDTDAVCRAEIQTGYSYGYPLSTVSAHVSACPNHQTLRVTPLETRFHVASFGVFGYECNLCDMKKEELEAIREQIALYKSWREVFQFGDFYRGRSQYGYASGSALSKQPGNLTEWTCVSADKTRAVGMIMQRLVCPNTQFEYYKAKGLDEKLCYHFYNRNLRHNIKDFGDLVNTVAPIHVKQDSLAHNLIAKFVKMDGEAENYVAYGDTLMYNGVRLSPAFGGTGYNESVRHFPDFGSRMYFMEVQDDHNEDTVPR